MRRKERRRIKRPVKNKILTSLREVRAAVKDVKNSLTDEQVFLSIAFSNWMKMIVKTLTSRKDIGVKMFKQESKHPSVAFTDGKLISINIANDLVNNPTLELSRLQKTHAFMGILMHECGHILFTDFRLMRWEEDSIHRNNIFLTPPAVSATSKTFTEWMQENKAGRLILPLYHIVDNCIEDGYIERRLLGMYPVYAEKLEFVRKIHQRYQETSTVLSQREKGIEDINILVSLILSEAKFGIGGQLIDKALRKSEDRVVICFHRIRPIIQKAVIQRNVTKRRQHVNELICELYELLKEFADNADDNSEMKKMIRDITKSAEKESEDRTGHTVTEKPLIGKEDGEIEDPFKPEKSEEPDPPKTEEPTPEDPESSSDEETKGSGESDDETEGPDEPEYDSSIPKTDEDEDRMLKAVEDATATEIVEKSQNDAITKRWLHDAQQVKKEQSIHSRCPLDIDRPEPFLPCWEKEHAECDLAINRIVRPLKRELRERRLSDPLTGVYAGQRLSMHEIYRKDLKIMTRKGMPDDIPDMECIVVIDESGSMTGDRIENARKCAYITYESCRELKIPCSVVGHDETFGSCEMRLHIYADSANLDPSDGKRIFSISAKENNRDGFSLWAAIKRLSYSDASMKFLFYISDGQPLANGYNGYNGKNDIQDALRKAHSENIKVVTAGLGSDSEAIRSLWVDGLPNKIAPLFLDVKTELLPKTFVKIIKDALK